MSSAQEPTVNSQTLRSGIAASTCVVCGIAVSVAVGVVPRAAGEDNIRLVSATTASASDASLAQLLYPTQPSHVQAPYRAAPVSHAERASDLLKNTRLLRRRQAFGITIDRKTFDEIHHDGRRLVFIQHRMDGDNGRIA